MVENLYNERILELAATLSKVGRLENAEFSSEAISRLCGSKVTVDLKIRMKEMLKHDGPPPSGKWSDLEVLQPVKDYKGRHSSVLLTFDAVEDCINQYLSKSQKPSGELL